jgi:hypothetical protein
MNAFPALTKKGMLYVPVRASANLSNARRSKAHLMDQGISEVQYMDYKESNMMEGFATIYMSK